MQNRTPSGHLLLLTGSGEGRRIAQSLADQSGLRVTASILHAPRAFGPLPVPHRIGRFGGDDGFRRYLSSHHITAVLDATHPFAHRVSTRSARICAELSLPYARVLRPAWTPTAQDNWTQVGSVTQATALIPPGARVFATTGRATLDEYRNWPAGHLFFRQMARRLPPENVKNLTCITGEGPFSVLDEVKTLTDLRIDLLVVKNSGGDASRTKLDAARQLGLPVILIARPPKPNASVLETVDAALDWVARL